MSQSYRPTEKTVSCWCSSIDPRLLHGENSSEIRLRVDTAITMHHGGGSNRGQRWPLCMSRCPRGLGENGGGEEIEGKERRRECALLNQMLSRRMSFRAASKSPCMADRMKGGLEVEVWVKNIRRRENWSREEPKYFKCVSVSAESICVWQMEAIGRRWGEKQDGTLGERLHRKSEEEEEGRKKRLVFLGWREIRPG